MKKLILLPILFAFTCAFAQGINNGFVTPTVIYGNFYGVRGMPYPTTKYQGYVSGSAYFSETWMKADVVFDNDKVANNAVVRIDLLDNSVEYIDPQSGQRMISTAAVKEIKMTDTLTATKYHFINSDIIAGNKDIPKGWYQLLAGGTATAVKRITKTVSESRMSYGTTQAEKEITTGSQYYVSTGTECTRVKKFSAIPDLFPAKKEELKKYIKDNNLNGNFDVHYSSVIEYYNSLVAVR
jgi:hypothetical protein